MRAALCAAAGLLSSLIFPSDLHACSCVTGIPICETFWKTDVVFAGEVVEQVRLETAGRPALFARRRVRFKVEGVYRGNVPDVVDVHTGAGGGDCGYAFRTGSKYLVYANRLDGKLRTGICNRTRPLARAAEDLEYFRTAMEPSATGRIFGAASYIGVGNQRRQPVRGYAVVLRDGRTEWRSNTDANGRFEFSVPAGKYTVRLLVPETEVAHGMTAIELSDPRGCATANFSVEARRAQRTKARSGRLKPTEAARDE